MVCHICLLSCEKALPPFWGKGLKKQTRRGKCESSSPRLIGFARWVFLFSPWPPRTQVFLRHIHWKVIYEMDYRWTTDYVFFKHDSIFRTLTVGTSGHCQLVKNILIFFIRRVILSSRPLLWLVRFKESHCLVRVSNSSFSCKQQALGRK